MNLSPYSEVQSLTTLASSNQQKTESELVMVFSEDEEENVQGKLVSISKGPHSKERKLSNEEHQMLPPMAKDGVLLRPCSTFASKSSTLSKITPNQQPLKPMTIFGFLQKSVAGNSQENTKKRVEKADFKSLQAFGLTSGMSKTDTLISSFTLS
jgi:hypothetical protein